MARMEKQRDKAAKRMERKLNRGNPEADPDAAEPDELGNVPTDDGSSEGPILRCRIAARQPPVTMRPEPQSRRKA